jgi:cytochrome c551/c552
MSLSKIIARSALSLSLAAATVFAADQTSAPTPAAPSRAWWAYQPLASVTVPNVKYQEWVRTPIDAFVLAKLEEKSLQPSKDADRAAFIRRATLDVWGLIPTPEEVAAFVDDRSPQAYERLVDRLLASPRYGERQGRRWLDLARYADSVGYTNDEDRPNAWRYRDYVIAAFNDDKPYDRFIREQIAGDELWPEDQQALIATGFLRYYPDDSNSRDLYLKKYDNTTDMTDTVGTVFLAQTVGCARCHNHKVDRISQKEYFQLQAFFANTSARDDIPAAKGPYELEYDRQQALWQEATKEIRAQRKAVLDEVRAKAEAHYISRFLDNTRASLSKPEEQWTPEDRWINNRNKIYRTEGNLAGYLEDSQDPADKERLQRYKALNEQLKKFDHLRPKRGTSNTISAVTELGHPEAPATHVLFTGALDQPREPVQPVIPAILNTSKKQLVITPTTFSSGRRTALAEFISDATSSPLTVRVYVNRIWAQYFGHGIVDTVSDFGRAGDKPTHPELLDYLANRFVADGWSTKKLHRQILLSSVYRQSSAYREDLHSVDPDNRLLGVFPRIRLDAEQIRDSLLVASGKLNETRGGPSVFPPIPATALTDNRQGRYDWRASADEADYNRRSVYIFTKRSQPYPLLNTFDMASADVVHSKRETTTTPLQSLVLINSDAVFDWSRALAGRVLSEAGPKQTEQFERLYQILYARSPDKFESRALAQFLEQQAAVIRAQLPSGQFAVALPVGLKSEATPSSDPVQLAAFVDLTHSLVAANEFVYRY